MGPLILPEAKKVVYADFEQQPSKDNSLILNISSNLNGTK